jgi:hypothetical protein
MANASSDQLTQLDGCSSRSEVQLVLYRHPITLQVDDTVSDTGSDSSVSPAPELTHLKQHFQGPLTSCGFRLGDD